MIFPYTIPYIEHSHGIFIWRKKREYEVISFPIFFKPLGTIHLSAEIIRNMDVWFFGLGKKLKVEYHFRYKHKAPLKWDYVACVSACSYKDKLDIIALNHTGKHTGVKNFHHILKTLFCEKLNALPYEKSPITKLSFAVGNCAEQNAANDILCYNNCEIKNLRFSKAIRPRTMTFIAPCCNCAELFPQIDN